ncbi:MAG: HEAT repeat domain-containing protein [Planctomycetes bacterium]|nr:HEAT repeat domain-containing protein [Planctomycetota bacterium]
MNKNSLALLVILIAAGCAAAQAPADALGGARRPQGDAVAQDLERDLERARLLASREGDLGAALLAYEKVARAAGAGSDLASRALLAKARVLDQLGRAGDARLSLETAAQGTGDAAAQARTMLEQASFIQDEDWQVSGRIHRAIAKLYKNETAKEAIDELTLIGGASVPALAEAMRNEKSDIAFLGRGVTAMKEIGGPRVAKWFGAMARDPDTIYRRTVLDQLSRDTNGGSNKKLAAMEIADDLVFLLQDEDLDVAVNACGQLGRIAEVAVVSIDIDTLLTFFDRCDSARLAGAIHNLRRLGFHDRALADAALRQKIVDRLGSYMERKDGHLGRQIEGVVVSWVNPLGAAGCELWFEFATRAPTDMQAMNWYGIYPTGDYADFPLERVVDYLRLIPAEEFAAFKELGDKARESTRVGAMLRSAQTILKARKTQSGTGRPEDVPFALEIIHMVGPDRSLRELEELTWSCGRPDDLQGAVDLIDCFAQPEIILYAISRMRLEPAVLVIDPLVDHLKKLVAAASPNDDALFIQGDIGQWVQAIVLREDPENLKEMMKLLEVDRRFYYPLCERMTKIASPAAHEHLLTLVAQKDEGPLAAAARHLVFQKLLESGDARAVPLLIAAVSTGLQYSASYKHGKGSRDYPKPDAPRSGLDKLDEVVRSKVWSGADLARIVDGVLAAGGDEAWRRLATSYDDSGSSWTGFPVEVRRLIEDRVLAAPEESRRRILKAILPNREACLQPVKLIRGIAELDDPVLMQVAISAMPLPLEPALKSILVAALDREEAASFLDHALAKAGHSGDPELRPLIRRRLSATSERLRRTAMYALVNFDAESAIPDIVALAKDPQSTTRIELCKLLARNPSRESAPVLIELLRDRESGVRQAADEALRQIQFYFEQKDRWEKWLKGAGLESGNAAEALLEQAGPGQPKDQRLLAIASLGSLRVPETLPILIRWTSDQDPEIAAAARKAVTRINGD